MGGAFGGATEAEAFHAAQGVRVLQVVEAFLACVATSGLHVPLAQALRGCLVADLVHGPLGVAVAGLAGGVVPGSVCAVVALPTLHSLRAVALARLKAGEVVLVHVACNVCFTHLQVMSPSVPSVMQLHSWQPVTALHP